MTLAMIAVVKIVTNAANSNRAGCGIVERLYRVCGIARAILLVNITDAAQVLKFVEPFFLRFERVSPFTW